MKILVVIRGFSVKISSYLAFPDFYDHIKKINFVFEFFISKLKIMVELIQVLKKFFLGLFTFCPYKENIVKKYLPKPSFIYCVFRNSVLMWLTNPPPTPFLLIYLLLIYLLYLLLYFYLLYLFSLHYCYLDMFSTFQ